ncbi:MAG: CDP-alcohol phosphatidyltransferase family protein [Chloroflexi bacterium]|nr:MAG: CDP-alcohol phosphatidyltransferase family protein [Chloroflexota bacterium]
MLDNHLRETKEQIFLHLAASLRLSQIQPIYLTLIAFVCGLVATLFLAFGQYIPGFFFWFCNRFFDGLDGTVARNANRQSDLGGYLDIMLDFVIYALLPLALVIANPSFLAAISLAFMLATFYINAASWMYLSALLEKLQHANPRRFTSVVMPEGLIGGAETIFFFSLFILWPDAIILLFGLFGTLVLATAVQRIIWAIRHLP